MDNFWEDFETGEIHQRDKWQFELKSDFIPSPSQENNVFIQEFFIFIPSSLQINDQTYSKARFYEDQTNLIRFKTPEFSFDELLNPRATNSPLIRLKEYERPLLDDEDQIAFEREVKLFANVFRSTLRDEAHKLIQHFVNASTAEELQRIHEDIEQLLFKAEKAIESYQKEEKALRYFRKSEDDEKLFGYVSDFLSISLNYSLSALLESIRKRRLPEMQNLDETLCKILQREKKYRETRQLEPAQLQEDSPQNESILYQSGLLNKFFIDVLLLNTSRAAIDQKYHKIIGGFAAAIAMSVYVLLFVWQGAIFVINSEPFILLTVLLYVLKDRLKDELKAISFNQAFRWFSDYKTEIVAPSGQFIIGELKESFSFIDEKKVPAEIKKVRSQEFHSYLETISRPERVIYYKKTINIFQNTHRKAPPRLNALNIIFRYDIHRFLTKASDPYEPRAALDGETLELTHHMLPKIYHINIILKNSLVLPDGTTQEELRKFRLVIDKDGIKRVENIVANGRR